MNQQLQDFARQTLKDGLAKLQPENRRVFALMYGTNNGKRSAEDATLMPINDVVDRMPVSKLDWAMQQVQASLDKQSAASAHSTQEGQS